eukprot:3933495-Rhodomonas_salina.3
MIGEEEWGRRKARWSLGEEWKGCGEAGSFKPWEMVMIDDCRRGQRLPRRQDRGDAWHNRTSTVDGGCVRMGEGWTMEA